MGENLEDLKEEYESLQTLLEAYNPWKGKDFDDLLDDFFEALKNDDKEFSWLKIDDKLYNELKDKKGKAVSIDYGIPSHVRGDIENGTLFLCLVNPNIDVKVAMCEACQMKNKEDIKKYLFDINSTGGILYKEIVELKGLKKLIGLEESDKDKNQEKNKIGYYTANYFYVILSAINDYKNKDEKKSNDLKKAVKSYETFISNLKENDDKKPTNEENINIEDLKNFVEKSKNIVNLEAFPFRSSTPNFAIDEDNAKDRFANCLVNSNSNVSMLSARIIIWKILEYIVNPKDNVKPVFIFRRFNRAWRPSIENVLRKDFFGKNKDDSVKEDKDDSVKEDKEINIAIDNIIKKLHEEFFYTIGPKEQDNVLKMSKNLYKNDEKISTNEGKENEFNELIIDALSVEKDNNGN
ncbi:MAG: hypothetical protein ACLRVE_07865 [Finegoldia magna]|uniref:hypothetical protein n=1 Tax=Finegoldia magna TaxID=1260 RepID=UPI0029062794|nr:hypothetical protein [Finegoldia magna]MDU5272140.1 hypothetical protein [Finegoldia magna]